MTKFDSGNGIVIFDSSAWSSSQQTSNYSNEISMVKNGDMASLLSFATAELAKVGYA